MATTIEIDKSFADIYEALDLKEQHRALRGAVRREANRLKKMAAANAEASGLGKGTRQPVSKSIRARVYPDRYGTGFLVTVKPNRKNGYHKNRQGKEKPVLMWAEDGTALRKTKSKTKFFIRMRKGHPTGKMKKHGFLEKTDREFDRTLEENLFNDFQKNVERAARKKGLL